MTTHQLSVNITPLERTARIVLGLAVVLGSALLMRDAGPGLVVALEVLLVLAGLDLIVTGATGHCPLYQKLGHLPATSKGHTS